MITSILLFHTNNSIQHYSFIFTLSNGSMYDTRADDITIYTKMAVEIAEFCCLLLY